jgi:DNA helicase-4
VIVAKAAFLTQRDSRQPGKFLLKDLARSAAAEMAARIKEKSGEIVSALMFCAF